MIYAKNNIIKLNKGRIDLIAYAENVAIWQMKKNKIDPENFEVVYVLSKDKVAIAFSKNIPDSIISKLH